MITKEEFEQILLDRKWIKYADGSYYNGSTIILVQDCIGVPEVHFLTPFIELAMALNSLLSKENFETVQDIPFLAQEDHYAVYSIIASPKYKEEWNKVVEYTMKTYTH